MRAPQGRSRQQLGSCSRTTLLGWGRRLGGAARGCRGDAAAPLLPSVLGQSLLLSNADWSLWGAWCTFGHTPISWAPEGLEDSCWQPRVSGREVRTKLWLMDGVGLSKCE